MSDYIVPGDGGPMHQVRFACREGFEQPATFADLIPLFVDGVAFCLDVVAKGFLHGGILINDFEISILNGDPFRKGLQDLLV